MNTEPIFIIGCPRSGTTLLRVILDSHPNICSGPETNIIEELNRFNGKINKNWDKLQIYGINKNEYYTKLSEVFSTFQEKYIQQKKKKRWAEKTPDNIFYVDFINNLFPKCQFINVIRDGRDVVCSFKERWGRKTILHALKTWNRSIDLTMKYRKEFDKKRYFEVRYEDLVLDSEDYTKKIMLFLGEDWSPKLLEHQKQKHDYYLKPVNKKEKNVREKNPMRHSPSKPIFTSSVGKWKKNLNFIERLVVNSKLKNNLTKLGYK